VLKASGQVQVDPLASGVQRLRDGHGSGRSQSLAGAAQTVAAAVRASARRRPAVDARLGL